MTDEEKEKRAILKGGIYAVFLAIVLLIISVLFAFLDTLIKWL